MNTAVISHEPKPVTVVEPIGQVRKYKKRTLASTYTVCTSTMEELLEEMKKLAAINDIDYIFMELAGTVEAFPITYMLYNPEDEDAYSILEDIYIDNIVTVIDTTNFWLDFTSDKQIHYQHPLTHHMTEMMMADLLINQIEWCNLLLMNKYKHVNKERINELEWFLEKLQPAGEIVKLDSGDTLAKYLFYRRTFDMEEMSKASAFLGEKTDESNVLKVVGEYGIGSFVYKREGSFHYERFRKWLEQLPQEILRSKGIVSFSEDKKRGFLSQAGPSITLEMEEESSIGRRSEEKIELHFIGIELPCKDIIDALDACLEPAQENRTLMEKCKDISGFK